MKLLELVNLSRLALRLSRNRHVSGGKGDKWVQEQELRSPSGMVTDIYSHPRRCLSVWVLVHGMTVWGGKEPRFQNFARALAGSGITCYVPTLPGLTACRWEENDLMVLTEAIRTAAHSTAAHNGTTGVMGFSFGGSYGLMAAAQNVSAALVRQVIAVGAYYRLDDLFNHYKRILTDSPQNDTQWDDLTYCRLALLLGYADAAMVSPTLKGEIEALLRRWCFAAQLGEKKEFFQRRLENLNLGELINKTAKLERHLSPAGRLVDLNCGVTVIHDRNDSVTPVSQAHELFAELQRLPNAKAHQLVMTSMLTHVAPKGKIGWRDGLRFTRALTPLIR